MSQLFLSSDSHFGHRNIIKYESRPFYTAEEMDAEIIRRWNKIISPEDRVIFLGDFCLRNRDYYRNILDQLNYHSMLWIKGNHDKGLSVLNMFPRVFAVKNAIIEIEGLGDVFLNHEPETRMQALYTLHGHIHGREGGDLIRARNNRILFHVGMDSNNLRPWHINEIVRECKKFRRK